MRQTILVDTTGPTQAVALNTDDLAKLFGSESAININSMSIFPGAFGTAVDYLVFADIPDTIDESAGAATTFPEAQLQVSALAATGGFTNVQRPSNHLIFRYTTADVQAITKYPSTFPVRHNLIITWNVEVDFIIEIDFTSILIGWDWRDKIMDLLANKTQVEDPSISNIDGKRSLNRRPLLLVAE